jgi:hypothetical protein
MGGRRRTYEEFVRGTLSLLTGKRVLTEHFGRQDPLVALV